VLTEQGRAKVGSATGYPELDTRRRIPGFLVRLDRHRAELQPYVQPATEKLRASSLGDAIGRAPFDLDVLERTTMEHHRLQQIVEASLANLGWRTGLPPRCTVLADLMAEKDGRWIVIEVKTLDNDSGLRLISR
jgi:hypothetical protein